jgi:hypothetical protein
MITRRQWVHFSVEVKDSDTGKMVSIPFEHPVERSVKVGYRLVKADAHQ